MAYSQLPPDILRVGEATPYALRDRSGKLLVPRGSVVASEAQLAQLLARDLYVDDQDSEALRRAMAGKLDSMVRKNVVIGRIADARPDATTLDDGASPDDARRVDNPIEAWSNLQSRVALAVARPFASGLLPPTAT